QHDLMAARARKDTDEAVVLVAARRVANAGVADIARAALALDQLIVGVTQAQAGSAQGQVAQQAHATQVAQIEYMVVSEIGGVQAGSQLHADALRLAAE